jgi:hypothetical protein
MARDGVFKGGPGKLWSTQYRNSQGETTSSFGYWVKGDSNGILYLEMAYSITDRQTKESENFDYRIDLTTTPCHFGGKRYWLICPLVKNNRPCLRRVGKLYLPPNGKYFGCRHCYNLTYKCQKEHDKTIDALRKNPVLLEARLIGGDAKAAMAALKFLSKY